MASNLFGWRAILIDLERHGLRWLVMVVMVVVVLLLWGDETKRSIGISEGCCLQVLSWRLWEFWYLSIDMLHITDRIRMESWVVFAELRGQRMRKGGSWEVAQRGGDGLEGWVCHCHCLHQKYADDAIIQPEATGCFCGLFMADAAPESNVP